MVSQRITQLILFISLAVSWSGALAQSDTYSFEFSIAQVSSISTDSLQFNLNFEDFLKGSETEPVQITYNIKANRVSKKKGLVSLRLDNELEDIGVAVKFDSYTKLGGDARLVGARSGFVRLSKKDQDICDKTIDKSKGQLLYGKLALSYKARAMQTLEAQEAIQLMTITLVDV